MSTNDRSIGIGINIDRRTRAVARRGVAPLASTVGHAAHQLVPDAEERIRAERRRVFAEMPRSEFAVWVRERKAGSRKQRARSGKPVPQRVCETAGCDRPAAGFKRICVRCLSREHARMIAAARSGRRDRAR